MDSILGRISRQNMQNRHSQAITCKYICKFELSHKENVQEQKRCELERSRKIIPRAFLFFRENMTRFKPIRHLKRRIDSCMFYTPNEGLRNALHQISDAILACIYWAQFLSANQGYFQDTGISKVDDLLRGVPWSPRMLIFEESHLSFKIANLIWKTFFSPHIHFWFSDLGWKWL